MRAEQTPFGSWLLGAADQGPRALRVRVQLLLTSLLVSTNVVGAGVAFLLSTLVLPGPAATPPTRLSLAIGVPVYVVVAVLVGAVIGTSIGLRSLRWAVEERDPDDRERRIALRLPWRLTLVQAAMWLTAAVVFTVLALVVQPERALTTAFTIATAGMVVSAIAYLFSEFALRPIAARALAGQDRLDASGFGVRQRMQVFWGLGTAAPVLGLMLTALLALTGQEVTVRRLSFSILVLGGIVLVFGLLVTWLNARAVVAPILSVRDALLAVQGGDFTAEVPLYDGTELGMLQSGFNQTVAGLRERERIRDLFGRHVGREVAEAAAREERAGRIELGGEQRVVSVLFVDVIGSTSYAAEHPPSEVVAVLNRFFGVVVDEVEREGGLVNKFIGDAVLAIFGAPAEMPDHPTRALAAARTMAARLAEEVPEISAGIGVGTGEAVAGNVGGETRFEYTVVGDAVNTAARLTELAKQVPGRVLVCCVSVDEAAPAEAARWTPYTSFTLRGRSEETPTAVLRE